MRSLGFSPLQALASTTALVALAMAAPSTGCGEEPPPFSGEGSGGSDNGATVATGTTGSGGAFVDDGPDLFAGVEPDLVAACASCHEPGGFGDAPFLAGPDRYQSMLSWPGIVVRNPEESILLTWAVSGGGHSGTNLDTAPNGLLARVTAWLEAEASAIVDAPEEEQKGIDPITPIMGFNALYLDGLGDEFTGLAITFTAEELTANSLKLDNVTVYTTTTTGVHMVHPVFATYPKGKPASPDPVDSFSDLDERYAEGTANPLGVGMVVLTNWEPNAKLGIGFGLLEPYVAGTGEGGGGGAGGGSTGGPCSAQSEFEQFAVPQLQMRCGGCHGGNNAGATGALDMSDLTTDPSSACGQVLNRVNTTTPAQSQIFEVTNPAGNSGHPFKFGGNTANFNTFRDQVSQWVTVE